MVKITFRPWEEVIIHESVQYSLEELVNTQVVGVPARGLTRPLVWVEGVVFRHFSMPPTVDVVKEQLEGKVHWTSVFWALMPEYKKIIEVKATKVKVPVNNGSANKVLSEVARKLKKIAKMK